MSKFLKHLNNGYVVILFLTIVSILVSVILQIFTRYVLNAALSWTEEFSLFAFCWFTFIGSATCSYENTHLEVDYFYNLMSPKFKKIANVFIMLIIVILSVIIIDDTIKTMGKQSGIKTVALRMPISAYTFAIVLGFIGILIFSAYHLYEYIQKTPDEIHHEDMNKYNY